jgi:hypothetical protein
MDLYYSFGPTHDNILYPFFTVPSVNNNLNSDNIKPPLYKKYGMFKILKSCLCRVLDKKNLCTSGSRSGLTFWILSDPNLVSQNLFVGLKSGVPTSAADLHPFDTDLDPACHFDMDPDFHFDTGPDPIV